MSILLRCSTLIPITVNTWFAGRSWGIIFSLASTLTWIIADIASGHPHSSDFVPFWNSTFSLSFYIVVTLILAALRNALDNVKGLARLDSLTGAVNGRLFSELVANEIERSSRYGHPFTVAYMDLDNFKAVNDQFGHSTGDKVLCAIVEQAKSSLRKVDVIARLGGDEFAFLFPETDQTAAQEAMQRVQDSLLEVMRRYNWPVTFSVGVLTCLRAPLSSDEVIRHSDELMYAVKNDGKNSICYDVYEG